MGWTWVWKEMVNQIGKEGAWVVVGDYFRDVMKLTQASKKEDAGIQTVEDDI